jgi:hypothetical protein
MDWRDRLDLTMLRAEARRKFQVMIDYIKQQVGSGCEYSNELVRVVVSERGCYYEFLDMPEEFSGALGTGFVHHFCGTGYGLHLMEQIQQMVLAISEENTRQLSVLAIYDRETLFTREGSYIYHRIARGPEACGPTTVGYYRPGVLPLFFKMKADSDLAVPVLGTPKGVLFFVANLTDQHLLVRIPHAGPGVTDLNELPSSQMVH